MSEKILFVDDEEHVLDSMRRQLRKRFELDTASSGQKALDLLRNAGPFAVVVSDMRMPQMDGIELLTKIRDLYPDTIRLMLTGNADQETATEAVNKGQIFRFLNKPCPTAILVTSLALALRQYRLVVAEKELLNNTLSGAVKVLSEILGMANPVAFSAGNRIKNVVTELSLQSDGNDNWQIDVAARMSQIGCITLPVDIINKVYIGDVLEPEEEEMYRNHPETGAKLLENIPRLETVAAIIGNQLQDFRFFTENEDIAYEVAIGAQILRVAIDHDKYLFRGLSHANAVAEMKKSMDCYNPKFIAHLKNIKPAEEKFQLVSMKIRDLNIGMVAEENIVAKNGVMLAPKGQQITYAILQGLKNFNRQVGIKEPILVRVDE